MMNPKTTQRHYLYLFAALVSFTAGCLQVQAQSLGLAPAQVVEKFKPGVPFEFDLSTVNTGETPVDMSVEITDFWFDANNEKVFSSPGTSPRSAANWIQFVPNHFEVGPHGTQKMKAIVTPPSDAKGGYYAVLFVQSKPQLSFPKNDGKGVFTSMRIGCLVLLRAETTEDYKIELSDVRVTPPAETHGLSVDFDLLNASNTHVFPRARVAVLDADRKMVAKAEGEEKRFLPGQKNSMHVEWSGKLPAGNYTALLTVAYGEDHIETQQIAFSVAE
ncbi:MAG TPA: hypothetical protein VGQ12_14735 [Candidatus Angelobacter sp.]|jgi:hypothetical protein|nr:hypothetical protein [Candidatus Angelobacter sp.]